MVLPDECICEGFSSFYFPSSEDLVQLKCTDFSENTHIVRIQTEQRKTPSSTRIFTSPFHLSVNPRWIPPKFICSFSQTYAAFFLERLDATNIFLKAPTNKDQNVGKRHSDLDGKRKKEMWNGNTQSPLWHPSVMFAISPAESVTSGRQMALWKTNF